KSADSLIQLAKGFYYAAEERNQKKFDSVGEFLNYVSLGIPKGMYLSYVERANKAFDSPNDTANWLTFGLHGTLREAMVPEDAWSPEHWSNIIGTVGFIEGTGSFFKPKPVLKNTVPKIKKAESSQALKPVKEVEGTGDGVRRSFRESTQSDRELVDSLRKKYTAGKKRNVAAVKGKIDGDEIDLESVSGEFTDNDYFNKGNFKPPQPEDYHYEGPISEFTSHTEQKIVEYLRLKYKDKADVKGKVEIISERPYCDNCIDLVDQFQKEFPNVEVVRVEVIPK
ncbi:deaminase domain-containing protein, partial [Paenibacillus forsythiae]|uniref:deaminase domain-containing protein n=1 Tax=Paenibacillus forsythiae TaxID=365616 RepID=UPI00046F414A